MVDGLALTISLGLQYGVPLKVFVDSAEHTVRTIRHHRDPNIRFVSSVLDYIARVDGGRSFRRTT